MSHEIVTQITYTETDSTLTMNHYVNNCIPYIHSTSIITADTITDYPEICDTDYKKVMYWLFDGLTQPLLEMESSVSVKFRRAFDLVQIASWENKTDASCVENFEIFLNALENGSKLITKGQYVVTHDYPNYRTGKPDIVYNKSQKGATSDRKRAKVFSTLEAAKIVAKSLGSWNAKVEPL